MATRLSEAERSLWRAFPTGDWVEFADISPDASLPAGDNAPSDGPSWGPERTIRAEVIASLLLGVRETDGGTVPAVRLRGARITGPLVLRAGNVAHELILSGCHLDDQVDFTGSITRTVRMTDCRLLAGFSGGGMRVSGHLSLSGSSIDGPVRLARAQFDGGLWLGGTKIVTDEEWAVYTASLLVDAGTFMKNADFTGGVRLVGARLSGGLFLEGATIRNPGKEALDGESMVVDDVMRCSDGFTAYGCVRLRGARINGTLSITGVIRSPDTPYALQCGHMEARELYLKPAEPIDGVVSLVHAQVGTLNDDVASWPEKLRINGLTYNRLTGNGYSRRVDWVSRDPEGFRAQPYEQLAAWYLRDGNESMARRTQLAKLRARRRFQSTGGRLFGRLLDVTVGYGYRPWLAALWFGLLLAVGTLVFGMNPPKPLKPAESPGFDAFAYTFDLLLPLPAFGQRELFDPVGWTQGLAYGLIVAGWILATALIAGATRVLRPS